MREGWKEVELKKVAPYWTEKISAENLNEHNYISTENLLPDKSGIMPSSYVPTSGNSTSFGLNDILVSNIRPYFKKIWFSNKLGGCSNDVIVFRTNLKIAEPKFVYYSLAKDDFFDFMMSGANGTKMPRGNKKSIPQYKILLPPLPTQRRIAAILSSYDDMIENNLRRIKLLEEQAQLTYEEWFVRLRFPGFEGVGLDEDSGLPVGWSLKKLREIAKTNSKSIKKGFSENIKYIDIAGVSPNKIDSTTEYNYSEAPGRAKRIVEHGDIIWSCVRPNRKSYAVIWNPQENLIASTGFCVISPKHLPTSYLLQCVTTNSFVGYLTNLAGGAAYPAVKAVDFEEADILFPPKELVSEYDKIFKNVLEVSSKLTNQNRLLKEARDILLPRLMMGMIDVK